MDKDLAPTQIVLRSIRLPPYTWEIVNEISSILTESGYDVSAEEYIEVEEEYYECENC